MAKWHKEAIGTRDVSVTRAIGDIRQRIDAGHLSRLHSIRRKDVKSGILWCALPEGVPPMSEWRFDIEELIELEANAKAWD